MKHGVKTGRSWCESGSERIRKRSENNRRFGDTCSEIVDDDIADRKLLSTFPNSSCHCDFLFSWCKKNSQSTSYGKKTRDIFRSREVEGEPPRRRWQRRWWERWSRQRRCQKANEPAKIMQNSAEAIQKLFKNDTKMFWNWFEMVRRAALKVAFILFCVV